MDTHIPDDHQTPSAMTATSRKSRRHFSVAKKCEMVEATLDGRRSVSVVAREYDVNANQLFRWRKQYRDGLLGETTGVKLLPVEVKVGKTPVPAVVDASGTPPSAPADGTLEVVLSDQHRIRISGAVCQQSLATILRVLS